MIGTLSKNEILQSSKLEKKINIVTNNNEILSKSQNLLNSNEYNNKITLSENSRESNIKYKLLWSGVANKVGNADSNGNSYSFGADDVTNYDYVLLEHMQSDNLFKTGNILNINDITKNKTNDVVCWGYDTRYTDMHFVNNGFIVDTFSYLVGITNYITAIYGFKF